MLHYTNKQNNQKLCSNETFEQNDKQNFYDGLIWNLLSKGNIFGKLLHHPVIQSVSKELMGENIQLLSYTANTLVPGKGGQTPHIDYPYWTIDEKFGVSLTEQPLAMVFIILLTDFTVQNGATALRPYSHKSPKYPSDQDEFFDNAIQIQGKAGDMMVLRSSLQHCAMPNLSNAIRSGVIVHMGPSFIRPYEDIPGNLDQSLKENMSPYLLQISGVNNPFPRLKV